MSGVVGGQWAFGVGGGMGCFWESGKWGLGVGGLKFWESVLFSDEYIWFKFYQNWRYFNFQRGRSPY